MENKLVRCTNTGFPVEIRDYVEEKLNDLEVKTNYEGLIFTHSSEVMSTAFESSDIQALVANSKTFAKVPEQFKAAFRFNGELWHADIPYSAVIRAIDNELSELYCRYGVDF